MSTVIVYTTSDKIRATLGLDENDIEELVITKMNLDLLLLERLVTVRPNHVADKLDPDVFRKLQIFCALFCAVTIVERAPFAIPKVFQANNDSLERFPVDLEAFLARLKAKLSEAENALLEVPTVKGAMRFSLFGKAAQEYDPITGTGTT